MPEQIIETKSKNYFFNLSSSMIDKSELKIKKEQKQKEKNEDTKPNEKTEKPGKGNNKEKILSNSSCSEQETITKESEDKIKDTNDNEKGTEKKTEEEKKKRLEKETKDQKAKKQSNDGNKEDKEYNGKPNFGQHRDESFFEAYAREIIFQLFQYPKLVHFKYDLHHEKNVYIKQISEWSSLLNEISFKDFVKKKKENKKNYAEEEKEDKIQNTCNINKKEKKSNFDSDSNIYQKKKKKNLKDNIQQKMQSQNDGIHTDSRPQNGKLENTEFYKGDFDVLIKSLDGKVLYEVLNDKAKKPFIFYGNFEPNKDEKYDIIGEVKENMHFKQKDQALKYIKLIYTMINSDSNNIQEKIGLEQNNKKILMYIFNSEYSSFLINIISFKVNFNKFKEIGDKNNKAYVELCNSRNNSKPKVGHNKLLNTIIRSDLPYIFIFVPNILKMKCILEKSYDEKNQEMQRKLDESEKNSMS